MPYSLTLPNGSVINNIPDDVSRGQALENLKAKMPDAFPAPPGIGEQLLGLPAEIGKGFIRGLTVDPASGIASLGYTGARAAGADLTPFEQTGVGKGLASLQKSLAPSDEGLITQFGSGLGSLASFIPGGLLKGGIGLAAKLTQSGAVGSEEARSRAEEARVMGEADATAGQQFLAQLGGTGIGFSELASLKRLTDPIEQILRGVNKSDADVLAPTLFNAGQRMLVTGGIEGFQEGMANIAQDLVAKGIYNPNLQVGESALGDAAMGASVGAFAQGAIDLVTRGKRRQLYEQVKEQEEFAKQAEEQRIAAEQQAVLDAQERQKQQQAMQALGAGPQIDPQTGRPILLLSGPSPEVNLQDPLGVRFGVEDLGPKVVSGINRARKERGLPPTQQFTIEDLMEAGSEKDAPMVSEMLARKIGYDPSVQVSQQSIFDLALSKNIDVETPGFADFLRRTTGSPDVANMTAPQLFAAQQSLSALPTFTETTQLPTGSQATSFDDKTYKKTVDGLKKTVLNTGPLGRSQTIEEIKGFSGLTETRDAERLLDTALRRGDLGSTPTQGITSTSINISLPTAPGVAGPDIRQGDYMDTQVAGYEVSSDDGRFKQVRPTIASAESLISSAQEGRQNTVEKLTGELEKTQATIDSNREKLNELDQIGEQDSAGYKKIESNTKNLVSKVSRLNEKIQSVSQPLQIKAKQEKKSRKGFTLFEGGKPVGTYPTQEDAEIAAVAFRTDEELDGIINAAPKAQLEGALEQPFGEQPVQVGTVRGGMPRRLYDEAVKEKDRRYRSQAGLPPPAAPVKIKITGDAQAAAERLRASGITVRFMPEVEKEIPEINKRLRAVLDKLGLKDIRLNIVDSLKAPGYVIYGRDGKPAAMFLQVPPGSPEYAKTMATIAQARAQGLRVEEDVFSANGSYAAKLIEIALDSKNPIRAARHEAIHALKELGFFTPQQWAVLERKAKSEWLKKYNIEGSGYGSLSKEGQIEEAIADAFSDFDQETPPTGQIGILFNKVKTFFEALGNAFRGSGFQTASDVFTLVEEGRLTGPGATGVTGTEATRYSVAPLSKGEVDALSASGPNSELIIDAYNRWAQAFSKLPSDIKNKLDALYVANRKTKLTAQDPGYSDRGARAAETRTFKAASQALEKHLGKELNPDELSLYLTDWRGSVDETLEKPPSFERNKYSLSQIPRVMSTGKIVGAPPGKNTEADRELLINEMVQLLEDPFTMFNKSRFWYENSGKTIREMTRSDPELMERVVRLLSLYSQANSLGGNTTATIKSISQLAQGAPTALAGRFPNETAKRIPAILSAPTMDSTLPGVDDKLMNFYRNLRDATFQDDTFSDASTVDRWMMRLFGYPHAEDQEIGGATGVSNTQYVYAKDLLKKIADIESERTGEAILPRQIQAALWTYVRNKTEFDSLPPEKQATFEPKNVDFADYVTRATVNITWESRPSTKINLIPGIHKASRRSQEEFNRAVREIFVDPTTGEDKIFKLLDNQQLYSSEFSIGAYENRVVPNVITRLVLQKDNSEYLTSVADNYAAIVGYVTKQDAVPWYRADPTATGKDASVGYRVTPSVASTIDFENKLFEHLNNKIPGIGFTRIGGSFDFVNFRDADTGKPFAMPDKKYIEKLQDALKTFAPDVNFNVVPFRAKSGWISNNWEENADGQGYLDRLRKAGLGDLQRVIDGWSETYGEIANDFGKEFGWARLSLKSNESIGGPSIGSGISIRPQQPTAQSFDAVHYGKQRVETLFGSMYGTGIKGAEAQRVFNSDDPRVRQRAYFYIPFNNGRMPKPEAGLGQEVHVQRLNNLLGPGPEMQGLASASRTPDGQFDENAFESSVIDAGYDGYAVPNMGMAVVLGSDVPVVSRGTRQEVEAKPDKDKIQIGDRKYSLRQTNTKEFKDWFGDSKIVNADSTPKVMYHGLAKDTTDFTRKTERGAPIFLTDDPTFAPRFAADSYASVARNPEPYLTKEQIDGGVKRAIAAIKKDYGKDSLGKEMIESLKTGNLKDATPEAREYIQKEFINLLPTGPHIMPLYVRAERSFDYDNPEHIERVINNLKDSNINTELLSYDLNKGDWETIESPRVQEAIKELGFDSFYVEEIGRKNLAVYEPNQVKSAIGNLGTFSRTNNDIRYSLALEGLKPSSALIPDEGGNPSGNLGFMPEKLGGKPIRLLVGTHNDLVDELVNEKMYRPVSYGGNHILNRIMSYPRREPIGAEELLEKIARAAQKTSQTYTRIYKDGKRFILFDGKNSLILGENPDSMSIITMYTQTDPNRRYGNPAWFGRAPVVPEFVGAIRGTKVEAKEGRIAPSEVDTKAKRVYTPSEVGAIAAGESTKEPTKGTISLGKKLSLRVPETVAVKKFLQGSPFSFDFETGDPLVFFRGQRRDAGPESFDIKTRATPSFTTNPHVASVYASRGLDTLPGEVESDWVYTDGSFLMPSFIQMKAAIDLRGYGNRPAILIDLFNDSGVDPAVFEDAPQELMDVLDELAQLQYSTGFQSGGAFESVEDALDAFRKDISKIDPDSLESRTEDAQEIIGNTVYGVLENLRIDPFAFADSQKVLDLVKQYYPKADAFIVRDVMSETLAEKLAEKGQIDDDSGYDTYKPFEVNQVKSIFNFNPDIKKKDVRYSLAGAANLQSFGLAPTDAKDNAIFLLQDKNIDLKRIIEGIRKNGKILSEDYDAYRKEELFHGRSATLIKFFLDRELRPLLQKMQNANISLEQMDDYLLARHAKEANAYIRKVNPDKSQNSGMTDKEADDFMKALPTSRRNALDSISRDIDAITKKTREIMVDTGLESQNTVNQWEKTYKNYVPLFREEIEDGRPISLGRGFDIRGSTTRQRMGSSRKVVDVLANIAMQRERTIVRGEKNRIGKSLYGLILDNPHKGFWGVINPEKMSKQAMRTELSNLGLDPNAVDDLVDRPPKKVINKSTGLVSYEVPQAWKSAPNIFATRINGEDRFMIFNKQDERAMRMVATLKSLDAQQQGEAIKMMGTAGDYYRKSIGGIGTVTRYFAQINTQYNPAFGIYNLMRDIGGAVLNLQTTPLKGQEAKVVSDALIALKAVYQDLRRQRQGLGANSKWASIFEEFESEGGKTGYRDLFETSESRAESLQQELKDFGQGKIRGSGKAVMGWLSDFNDAIENSVRVSVYHNAKQEGLSNAAAASLAKNITVNFNRSGAVSRNFQTLFAFFNASIQGTARIAQTLLTSEGKLSPTGKKIVMGGITLGIIQAALLAMAGLDEDEVPDFVKDKSFVIPYGDGKYFAIPMPLGYNVIPSFGRRVMEFAMSDEKNVGKAVFDTSSMIIDGFNPLGSATFVQTLTPTILDPIVALAENKDFTGKPISRDDINSLSPTPGYTRGSQNSFAITEALAYGINILTGGSEFKKGALSPTPDQIEYLVGEAFGGVGREALKVGRGIESLATGEELATYNVPIVGRLTGNVQQQAAQRSKFFNNIRRLNEHQAEIEGRLLQGDDINDYIDQYPESSLYQAGDKIYNQITKLRRTKKVLEESGAGKDDLKSIDETILSLMSSLNEIYDSARQQ
jgi:hypothetical protein